MHLPRQPFLCIILPKPDLKNIYKTKLQSSSVFKMNDDLNIGIQYLSKCPGLLICFMTFRSSHGVYFYDEMLRPPSSDKHLSIPSATEVPAVATSCRVYLTPT